MPTILRHTCRRLHEEHVATAALLARLQGLFAAAPAGAAAPGSPLERTLRECAVAMAGEVGAHFDFEEQALFPRLEAAGERELVALLAEEHVTIRSAAAELATLQAAVAARTLDAAGWTRLKAVALELAERLTSHIDKEESALLPALEDLLDDETDLALIEAHPA